MRSITMSEIALMLRYKRTHPERRKTDVFDPKRPFVAVPANHRNGVQGRVRTPKLLRVLAFSTWLDQFQLFKGWQEKLQAICPSPSSPSSRLARTPRSSLPYGLSGT